MQLEKENIATEMNFPLPLSPSSISHKLLYLCFFLSAVGIWFRTYVNFRRLMFKKEFDSSYVGFMRDGAKWLVENTDIKLVGKIWFDLIVYLVLPNNDTHILHCVKHLLCVATRVFLPYIDCSLFGALFVSCMMYPATMSNWYCTCSKSVPAATRTNIILLIE